MSNSSPFSLADMRATNGAQFSDADYLHYVIAQRALGSDFAEALFRFLAPEFEEVEGKFLTKAVGAPAKYRAYREQGQPPSEAQYWANLTEISGLFGVTDYARACAIASMIERHWQASLVGKSQDRSQQACVTHDEVEQEVFVTIRTI